MCWVCSCCLSKFWLAVAVAALTHLAVRSYIFIRWEVPPSDFYTPIDYAVINPNDTVGVYLHHLHQCDCDAASENKQGALCDNVQ